MKNEMAQTLNWEIELKPVIVPGVEQNTKQALVRSDNKKLLGIRSNNYHPVFNSDMELMKNRILEKGQFDFKGYEEFQDGKRILAFFENKKEFKLCGDRIKDYLIVGNSNDATSKLFIGTSNYMFRCENQFSEKIRSIEWRHDKPFDIDRIQIDEILCSYRQGRKELYGRMERLKSIEADMELVKRLAMKLMGTEKNTDKMLEVPTLKNNKQTIQILNCIEQEILELGPTLWGVFNGVTRYTSHHLKGNQGFGVVNGLGERMNRQAMEMLLTQ